MLVALLFPLLLAATGQSVPAAEQNAIGYEGQPVVAVAIAGRPDLDATPLLSQLPQKAGEPYSKVLVQESAAALRAKFGSGTTGLQGVTVAIRPTVDGLRILFVLEPAEYFGVYEFPGALKFSYTRLLEAAQYQSREPYTQAAVTGGVNGVTKFLRQEGYFAARVEPRLQVEARLGLVNVEFYVTMGPRARYGEVTFPGASAAEAEQLASRLGSWRARLRRSAIQPGGSYSFSALQSAGPALQSKLNGQGRLGAQVRYAGADYNAANNRAAIRFEVESGPVVHLSVSGAHLWPWTRSSVIPIYQESRVDPELIQEGQDNLANYFTSHGYFDAVVTTIVTTESTDGTKAIRESRRTANEMIAPLLAPATAGTPRAVTIAYTIAKGPRHKVERIAFAGNRMFASDDLMARVELKTGSWLRPGTFSAALLQSSVDHLTALYQAAGYSAVQVEPELFRPGGNLVVRFQIDEGSQDFVASLQIEGNGVRVDLLAPHGLRLGPGTPFAQSLVAEDRAQILAYYLSHGFLNASFRATAARTDEAGHELNVVYQISEGAQVQTRRVVTVGGEATQERFIDQQTANLRKAGVLSEGAMLSAESRLYSLGIFDWAEVSPRRPIT
ncbi:MAG: POTRA domain-containing protein, partial [Terriglobia bacterium]